MVNNLNKILLEDYLDNLSNNKLEDYSTSSSHRRNQVQGCLDRHHNSSSQPVDCLVNNHRHNRLVACLDSNSSQPQEVYSVNNLNRKTQDFLVDSNSRQLQVVVYLVRRLQLNLLVDCLVVNHNNCSRNQLVVCLDNSSQPQEVFSNSNLSQQILDFLVRNSSSQLQVAVYSGRNLQFKVLVVYLATLFKVVFSQTLNSLKLVVFFPRAINQVVIFNNNNKLHRHSQINLLIYTVKMILQDSLIHFYKETILLKTFKKNLNSLRKW